jgi:hypothetical protein
LEKHPPRLRPLADGLVTAELLNLLFVAAAARQG